MNMLLMDAIDTAKYMQLMVERTKKGIEESIERLPIADTAKMETLKMWVNRYIDGGTSYESLCNIAKMFGVEKMTQRENREEVNIDENGKLVVYERKKE